MANYDSNPNNVKLIQHAINVAGYPHPLTEDGVYGPMTKAGVVWFQGKHGLTQDGIIGDATMAAAGPTPPGGDPLAGMKAAIAALKATQDAAAAPSPSPAAPAPYDFLTGVNFAAAVQAAQAIQAAKSTPKVIKLGLPSIAASPVAAPAPVMAFPQVSLAPVVAPAASPLLPIGIGAALGGGLGFALSSMLAFPMAVVIGGGVAVGAAAGLGFSKLHHSTATVHGEADFGVDFGCDDEELTVIAGEIGMPTRVKSLGY